MSLHTAFGAAHGRGGLRHIEFFPVTQQKGFTLTRRQAGQSLLDEGDGLALFRLTRGVLCRVRVGSCLQSFEEVEIIVFAVLLVKR